ncbi:hypothetical protein OG563_44175 [Nocardia vinacea]|uniref:Secreted protein n=1 Tax=Nocardia vinacea TaxID=96468 RepID=A0ABZ1YS45_9NOCA|nr:hypothetical protein [Nocardia vinacea]
MLEIRLPAAMRNGGAWLRRFAGTTPGAIGAVAVVTVVLCVLAGLTSADQLSGKIARRDIVLEHTEPLAYAAQTLYVALSAADASAATAFLSGGIESPVVRGQYQQALAEAASALAEATAGAADQQTRNIVAKIAADLPAYTGLVETARANNRQGFPVGSSYLREASLLMQNSLLPNAETLSKDRMAALRQDQHDIGALPWATIVLLMLVLIGCGGGTFVLLRRTNRRMNLGLAVAAGATALALFWVVAATIIAAAALDTGKSGATSRFETLTQARILAQQARTDETLELITRGDITTSETDYRKHTTELADRLATAAGPDSAAARSVLGWTAGHAKQREAYEAANYPAAVAQAIGTGPDTSATLFAHLDQLLRDNLIQERGELRDGVDSAGATFTLSPAGTLVLLFGAAASTVTGLWPRVKEFL